jgi:hypothetical protein
VLQFVKARPAHESGEGVLHFDSALATDANYLRARLHLSQVLGGCVFVFWELGAGDGVGVLAPQGCGAGVDPVEAGIADPEFA